MVRRESVCIQGKAVLGVGTVGTIGTGKLRKTRSYRTFRRKSTGWKENFHWYMIRHSTGTYMNHMGSGKSAVAQIRSEIAPEKYDQSPPELRREELEKM